MFLFKLPDIEPTHHTYKVSSTHNASHAERCYCSMLKCKNVSLIPLQGLRKTLDVVFLSTQWTAVVVVAVDVSSTHAYAYSLSTNVQGKCLFFHFVFSPIRTLLLTLAPTKGKEKHP